MGNCTSRDQSRETLSTPPQTSSNHNHQSNSKPLTVSEKIDSTKAEVSGLLVSIDQFQGITEDDKQYRYLDEMLTRCIIGLDSIQCNSSTDRENRRQAIKGINKAISILERKVAINSDIKKLETDLTNL